MLSLIALGAVAGLIPVYLGILSALFLGKVMPRTWEGGLTQGCQRSIGLSLFRSHA